MTDLREQWLLLISTPVYLIIIGLELLLSHLSHTPAYSLKGTLRNLYMMLLNSGIDLLFRAVYVGVWMYAFQHSFYQWETQGFWYWTLLLLAVDFLYYWLHRFDHEIRMFWAVHVTHHSSEEFNFSVGFRSSVFQPLYRFVYFLPLPLLGFAPVDILFMYSATQIWGIAVHTKLVGKMGLLEHILVTPSHHRVHHASNPLYLDKNMGMFLIVWDKWFGTFQAEEALTEPVKYGLTTAPPNDALPTLVLHEWRSIVKDVSRPGITLAQRCKYLFGLPGYSHDGSRKTSQQMRDEVYKKSEKSALERAYNSAEPVPA